MSLSACAKAKAETPAAGPPLAAPAPPARVLAPVDEPLAAAPIETEPPTATAPRTPARPPVRRANAAGADVDVRPSDATQPAAQGTPTSGEAPRELRPPSPADTALERKVRDILVRASRDLGRVDYRRLSTEGRSQYDQSKRFVERAEETLRERDFVFAQTLADKAATLAAELLNR